MSGRWKINPISLIIIWTKYIFFFSTYLIYRKPGANRIHALSCYFLFLWKLVLQCHWNCDPIGLWPSFPNCPDQSGRKEQLKIWTHQQHGSHYKCDIGTMHFSSRESGIFILLYILFNYNSQKNCHISSCIWIMEIFNLWNWKKKICKYILLFNTTGHIIK